GSRVLLHSILGLRGSVFVRPCRWRRFSSSTRTFIGQTAHSRRDGRKSSRQDWRAAKHAISLASASADSTTLEQRSSKRRRRVVCGLSATTRKSGSPAKNIATPILANR